MRTKARGGCRGLLYKTLQVAPPVPLALSLSIALDRLRVGLPVLPGIIRMAGTPFLLAVLTDLAIHGIGFQFAAVIFSSMVPSAGLAPTNDLVRMRTGRLKALLAVAASAIAHRGLRIIKAKRYGELTARYSAC